LSLADFVVPSSNGVRDTIAAFVVSAGEGIRQRAEQYKENGEYLKSHAIQALAIETADVTLMSGNPTQAVTAIDLARRTLRGIRQNLWWAFAYNVAAIPLAVAGLLDPMIASLAMALSSVSVVSNSLRIRRWNPEQVS